MDPTGILKFGENIREAQGETDAASRFPVVAIPGDACAASLFGRSRRSRLGDLNFKRPVCHQDSASLSSFRVHALSATHHNLQEGPPNIANIDDRQMSWPSELGHFQIFVNNNNNVKKRNKKKEKEERKVKRKEKKRREERREKRKKERKRREEKRREEKRREEKRREEKRREEKRREEKRREEKRREEKRREEKRREEKRREEKRREEKRKRREEKRKKEGIYIG
ncbi:hypothetical protein PANDA_000419 [Ailuropoda melanoleuca]|uniref:Uncharacterized protein n=1 Tax=Ailuropoda melanoleuca TaxID=9646 RepID=D2GUS8_AILME|nr:hypothetical protein PANDA_000419 [Ailuropoda melanoleuca]